MKKYLFFIPLLLLSIYLADSHRPVSQVSSTVGRASENAVATPLKHFHKTDHEIAVELNFELISAQKNLNRLFELNTFYEEVERKAVAEYLAHVERERRHAARLSASMTVTSGKLPPVLAKIALCESGQNGAPRYHLDHYADRPHINSSASGAFGFLDGTWDGLDGVKGNGFKGYMRAFHAPPEIQNEGAIILYNGGKGLSNWNASRHCWG